MLKYVGDNLARIPFFRDLPPTFRDYYMEDKVAVSKGRKWFSSDVAWYPTGMETSHARLQKTQTSRVLVCLYKLSHHHQHHHQHHHHHISVMELGHLLTRSGLTYPEVSSKFYHDYFCQLGSNVSLPWVTYFEAFYLHVVSSFSCIPIICPKLVLFLNPLQFVHLFYNLSKCTLLFFSCISSLLLLFFWRRIVLLQ